MPLTHLSNPAGSGTFTIQNPASASNRTLTYPDATTTLVGTDATQTLTNKTIQGGVLTLGTAVAASGAAVDFTGIPSWAKRITLIFRGVSSTGTSNYLIRTGSGTFTTTGYASTVQQSGISATTSVNGFIITQASTAANTWSGVYELMKLDFENVWIGRGTLHVSGGGSIAISVGSGTQASLDSIQLTTVLGTDTFDAGTINIVWEG